MELITGKNAGFCYGVKNAVDGTKEILKNNSDVYCLGEIVHNKDVVEELVENGLKVIQNIEEGNGKVIIRAHGIPKKTYNRANEQSIELIDYTCPNVKSIHSIAEDHREKGFFIFLIALKTHPETIGTISFCGDNSIIIENEEDISKAIQKLKKSKIKKVLVIAQTTFENNKFQKYVKIINEKLKEMKVELIIKNTICNTTQIRQKETDRLSKIVDFMIIIGGKNSSNTNKLYDVSKLNCKNTIMIENKNELDFEQLRNAQKVGIMAGASTSQQVIDDVINHITKHCINNNNMLNI